MKNWINQKIESGIDKSPAVFKKCYVQTAIYVKWILKKVGFLAYLNKKALQSSRYHYLRSLLAIHQLDDMIYLDVPWWTYSAIDCIEQYLKSLAGSAVVFEYGSGASTIWLAKRCAKVVSIEHDITWYENLKNYVKNFSTVELILKTPDQNFNIEFYSEKLKGFSFQSYVQSIDESQLDYDLIIIDGRCRAACLSAAIKHLKPTGIILFDNSNRKRYQAILNSSGLNRKSYVDLVPGSPFKSETAILSYENSYLGLK